MIILALAQISEGEEVGELGGGGVGETWMTTWRREWHVSVVTSLGTIYIEKIFPCR